MLISLIYYINIYLEIFFFCYFWLSWLYVILWSWFNKEGKCKVLVVFYWDILEVMFEDRRIVLMVYYMF